MKKLPKFTVFILLAVLLFFASCKKEKEIPITISQNTETEKEIIFSNLKWELDTITNMLTTNLSIPSLYSADSILVVYGGSDSRIIPKEGDSTLSALYYKTVNNEVIIYKPYTGSYPDRNSFNNPMAYAIACAIWKAESIFVGSVKVIFR